MGSKWIGQVDLATGEVLEGTLVYAPAKRANGFQRWMAMSQNALNYLASLNLQGNDYRVFFSLAARLDFENFIHASQTRLCEELDMKPAHVSRSVKRLIEAGILIRGPKVGRCNTYRLNPQIGWKGSARNHQKALEARMRAAGITGLVGGIEEPEMPV